MYKCSQCGFEGHITEFPYEYVPDEDGDGFDEKMPYCPNCKSKNIEEIE